MFIFTKKYKHEDICKYMRIYRFGYIHNYNDMYMYLYILYKDIRNYTCIYIYIYVL